MNEIFIVSCSATVAIVILVAVLCHALHEWGIAKGRIIQFEQLMKVRPLGKPDGLRPYKEGAE